MTRCPSCRARDFRPTERCQALGRPNALECSHCGLIAERGALQADANGSDGASLARSSAWIAGEVRSVLAERLEDEVFALSADDPVFLESYALRTLALSKTLAAIPADAAQWNALKAPYTKLPAQAKLVPLGDIEPVPVSVIILCRPGDVSALTSLVERLAPCFADIVLLIDGEAIAPGMTQPGGPRLAARPLAGHFAAQRNAGQDLALYDWVLQLDADEELAQSALGSVGHVAAYADQAGTLSVGLLRENRVDRRLSDLFPDVQYRLNRKAVRYAGAVHERPDLPRGWRDSMIAPNLVIEHRLSRAHVEARSKAYEAMSPGHGRTFEAGDLLRPYRP
ncbi:hypothetical protein SAMN06297251_111137 [Fulvimarina manganoxydans]|uniref:Glycosyl transferase family 2 n=1 Tax=Fulvimarina manganoxydans TaxID=937218 RepID=A0A1W2CUZ7_9HYPH|nr:hypothetical protein [Fulvimarina manganoxydans]SMC89049.1 hypothetical protein SAMN06297251_111137 [Fulvimarina manganoxydans]